MKISKICDNIANFDPCMYVCMYVCMYDWFVPFGNSTKGSLDRITSSWHNTTHNTNVLRLACIFVISHILADFSRRYIFLLSGQCSSSEFSKYLDIS